MKEQLIYDILAHLISTTLPSDDQKLKERYDIIDKLNELRKELE